MSKFQIISEFNKLQNDRENIISSDLSSVEKSMKLNIANKQIKDMKRLYSFLK